MIVNSYLEKIMGERMITLLLGSLIVNTLFYFAMHPSGSAHLLTGISGLLALLVFSLILTPARLQSRTRNLCLLAFKIYVPLISLLLPALSASSWFSSSRSSAH